MPLPRLLAFLAAAGAAPSPLTAPAAGAATLAADPPVLLGQGEGRMNPSSGFYSFPGASGAVVGQANNTMLLSTDGTGARWQPADLPEDLLCALAPVESGRSKVGRCLGRSTLYPLRGEGASAAPTLSTIGAVPDFDVYWKDKAPRSNFTQHGLATVTLSAGLTLHEATSCHRILCGQFS